jgi:hypothetical protein
VRSNASLAAEVDALAGVDPSGLSIGGLQDLVVGTGSVIDRLAGVRSRALGELVVRGGGQVPDRDGLVCPIPAWLRQVAKVTGNEAGRQVRTSLGLRELPVVAGAVVAGEITLEHARVLTGLVGRIEPTALLASQGSLIEVAGRTDPDQLTGWVRHQIATWCEPDLQGEEAAAEDRRFLTVTDKHNGSWRLTGELPDAAVETLLTVLEPLARRAGDDDRRSAGQRRADALGEVCAVALRHADLPDAGGQRPRLTYLVPVGLADAVTDRTGRPEGVQRGPGPPPRCAVPDRRLDRPGHPKPDRDPAVRGPDRAPRARRRRAGRLSHRPR